MKYTGYIYIIENIINNLKYVGKTDNLRRRWNEHIRLNHSSCTALVRAMKKYGVTNFKMYPIFTIKATTIDNFNCMLNTLESFYIKKYNTYKHGYNCTTGGEGSFGHIVSEETKLKMSKKQKGRKLSEEHRKKCSLGMKGKHHTKETCEKIRQALLNRDKEIIHRISLKLKGRKLDKQSIINSTLKRFKPVLQYDLNGNFIKEYKGIKNIIGISDISIINCCKGHTKTANGYIWKYKTSNNYPIKINPIKECHSRNRKIAQYDINNNLIKIYTSKSEILSTLKIKKSALKMCLCGKNKTSGGFIWKYIIERREFNEKL